MNILTYMRGIGGSGRFGFCVVSFTPVQSDLEPDRDLLAFLAGEADLERLLDMDR